jgi:hypothetical protein
MAANTFWAVVTPWRATRCERFVCRSHASRSALVMLARSVARLAVSTASTTLAPRRST